MIWRAAATGVVLFWAVMTGLLIRDSYFPDESRFAEIPPRFVFDLFLKQAEVNADTLHLYHRQEKIGHANIAITASGQDDARRYDWLARGLIERLQDHAPRTDVTWEVAGAMNAEGDWQHLEILAAIPAQKASVKVRWLENETFPNVTVTQNGKTVLDSQNKGLLMALGMAGMGASGDWTESLGMLLGTQQEVSTFAVTAREGSIELAGRTRKCYFVLIPLPGSQQIRMIFGETGELARIELPQDYVLLEPMINGMLPPLTPATPQP